MHSYSFFLFSLCVKDDEKDLPNQGQAGEDDFFSSECIFLPRNIF